MSLEKILVGDDELDFARENFPLIPDAEVEFVSDPDELVQKAQSGEYSTIVTDLNYTENGEEGYIALEALQAVEARKVLWTGNAYDEGVRERAQELGAEVLDKDEIGALVGQVVSKAPLKQNGKVLVYASGNGPVIKALEKTTGLFFTPEDVVVSSDLKEKLSTGEYGLVIDTSTMVPGSKSRHGVVAHDMKYLHLEEVPRIVNLRNVSTVVMDIARIAEEYLKK
jgi:hypothetical protein